MRYILLILFSVSILTACVIPSKPIKRTYAHPKASGGVIKTYGDIIYSKDIPTRAIVINAPHGVEFRVISHSLRRVLDVEDYDLSGGTGFAIQINIPDGVVGEFLSNKFSIEDRNSGEIFVHTQEEINYHSSREKMRMDARLILDGVSKKYTSFQSMPFMDQLVGSTKENNIPAFNGGVRKVELKKRFWTVFRIKGLKSTEYSLEIPTIKINGTVFQIPRIDFRVKTGMFLQFEVYP